MSNVSRFISGITVTVAHLVQFSSRWRSTSPAILHTHLEHVRLEELQQHTAAAPVAGAMDVQYAILPEYLMDGPGLPRRLLLKDKLFLIFCSTLYVRHVVVKLLNVLVQHVKVPRRPDAQI